MVRPPLHTPKLYHGFGSQTLQPRASHSCLQHTQHSIPPRYVLAVFAFLTTNQTVFWFSFSSAPDPVNAYFGTTDADLDLLLNWGPIVFLPVCPLVALLLRRPRGLNLAMRAGAYMCFIACAVRALPCLLSPALRSSRRVQLLLHAGQIINAAVGPIVMSSPSLLSSLWFPPHRRATATSLAYLGGNLGGAIGFLLGPYIIADSADNVPRFLLVELIMASLPMLLFMCHCPSPRASIDDVTCSPSPQAPHASPSLELQTPAAHDSAFTACLKPLLHMLSLPSLLLLCVCGGVQAGVSSAWSGVLPQMLTPPRFSSVFVGWLGFAFSIGGVVGNAGAGVVADVWFVQRYKRFLIWVFILSAACFALFTLSLPNPFISPAPIPSSETSIMIIGTMAGVFQSACDPLFYELAAEISFPLEEGTSASLIAFLFNAATLIMLFVAPVISISLFSTIMTATLIVCALGVCFSKESYHRRAAALARANAMTLN
jgi:FLVCR family MFS transporter